MSTQQPAAAPAQTGAPHDPQTGEVVERALVRDTFNGAELAAQNETAIAAVQARAQAIVQSKYVMALKRPRNPEQVRAELLKECTRPSFAAVARYKRPQGRKQISVDAKGTEVAEGTPGSSRKWVDNYIEGPSIRFVEAAIRALGNCDPGTQVLYEDDRKIILRVEVCDYERNVAPSQELIIEKTVERRDLKRDKEGNVTQVPIGRRTNSYGDTVYLLPATEDEVRLKVNRAASMAIRTLGLRLVPGDLLDQAMTRVIETQRKDVKDNPDRARLDLLDRFAAIGIAPAAIAEYLGGRTLEQASPDEILELRAIGALVADGEARWPDVLANSPYREQPPVTGPEPSPAAQKGAAVREKIAARVGKVKEKRAADAKAKADAEAAAKDGGAPVPAAEGEPAPAPTAGAQASPPAPTPTPTPGAPPGAPPAEAGKPPREPGDDDE